ncbi:hypothetical protein Pcac1_g9773 [Phytophthora cactorum]|nr:hypothetical protein Pcac1_g9773 [Phytophthora cactorum]
MRIPPQVPDGAAEPIWKLATRAAIKLMSTALYSKRFIGASALLLYGYASYPIAEPTSTHSLRLAQGLDAHELDRNDPFAINVRKIAARVGVKNPERISIRVGEQSAGASMGANLTVGQRGACIVLPMELYDAFYAPAHLHAKITPCSRGPSCRHRSWVAALPFTKSRTNSSRESLACWVS